MIKPLYIFAIEAQVQNASAPQEWSMFITLLSMCYIFQIVNDVGIHSFNLQFIPKNRNLVNSYISQILAIKGVLAIIYFVAIASSFWALGYASMYWKMLCMIGVNQILNSLLLYLRSNISGLGLYRWDSFLSILDKLILIILIGGILYTSIGIEINLYAFIIAQGVSFFIPICVALGVLLVKKVVIRLHLSRSFFLALLKQTYPYAIIFLLMTAYSKVDILMLDALHPQADIEIDAYSASIRIFDASNMFAYLFVALILPMVARLIAEKKDLNALIDFGLKLMFCFAIVIAVSASVYSEDFLALIYDRSTDYIADILVYHMIGFVGIAIAYIYGSSLVAGGNVMRLNVVFFNCLIMNIILNFILIPKYGAIGAAMASAATQLLSMLGQIIVAHQLLAIQTSVKLWLKIILYGWLICLLFYMLDQLSWSSWWISSIIGIIIAGILALLMDMIQRQELLSLFRKKIDPRSVIDETSKNV